MSTLTERVSWGDLVRAHRFEFPFPALYTCYAVWGACYAAGDVGALVSVPVLATVAANVLLVLSGLALNTAVDIQTDQRHPERSELATAALRFGRVRVLRWAATEMTLAWGLAGLVSWWSQSVLPTATATAIIGLHLLYNLEPVRLKRRGFVGVSAFCAAVVVLPGVLAHSAVRALPETSTWLVLVGAGVLAIGRMTWWSLPDRTADAATGMATPTVRHGAVRALLMACSIMLAGLVLVCAGLWSRFGPYWAFFGIAAHTVFLAGAASMTRAAATDWLPSSIRMRTHNMPVVVLGEVMLAVTPLVAGVLGS